MSKSDSSGLHKRVLRFAVSGLLVAAPAVVGTACGGGTAEQPEHTVNEGPQPEPIHTNEGPQEPVADPQQPPSDSPPDDVHTNEGPQKEPEAPPTR